MITKCQACGVVQEVDRAHVRTRGAGAGWGSDEWILLCRTDHIRQGQLGWKKFIEMYPHLIEVLKSKGWELRTEFGISKIRRINA